MFRSSFPFSNGLDGPTASKSNIRCHGFSDVQGLRAYSARTESLNSAHSESRRYSIANGLPTAMPAGPPRSGRSRSTMQEPKGLSSFAIRWRAFLCVRRSEAEGNPGSATFLNIPSITDCETCEPLPSWHNSMASVRASSGVVGRGRFFTYTSGAAGRLRIILHSD